MPNFESGVRLPPICRCSSELDPPNPRYLQPAAGAVTGHPRLKRRVGDVARVCSRGWLAFSDVLLTGNRLDALVYYEAHCGGLCGETGYAWLHRDSVVAGWTLARRSSPRSLDRV